MNQLWLLYQLSLVDRDIEKNRKSLKGLQGAEALEKELAGIEKKLAVEEELLKKTRLEMKKAEMEADSLDTRKKKLKEKIYGGKSVNPKELQSWQTEVENLQAKQDDMEDGILETMSTVEEMNSRISSLQGEKQDKISEIASATEKQAEEKTRLNRELSGLENRRQKFTGGLEPAVLGKYDQIRLLKDDKVAVARIEDDACGGCYMNVPDSRIKQVQAHRIITCDTCMRILYWEDTV